MPATPFQTEAWTEYGLGTVMLFLRYVVRWRRVGWKGMQGDDYFAFASLIFWTAEVVMMVLIGQNGTNIGITNEMGAKMTDAQIARLEFGSKCLLAGWNFYVTLIFCLKGVMLCFYSQMTLGLWQRNVVIWTQFSTVLAYGTVLAVIWAHCTPVHKNWQVYPNPGESCTLAVANYITLVVLNVTTDLVIVSIPMSLLWTVKLSIKRKLTTGVILCSGVFIIIITLLRCIFSLRDIQDINTSTIWAIRETFVAIIVANAAAIKPLFSTSLGLISCKGSIRDKGTSGHINKYGHQLGNMGGSSIAAGISPSRRQKRIMTKLDDNSSEEHIVGKAAGFGGYRHDAQAGSTTSGQVGNLGADGIVGTPTCEVTPGKSTLDV